MNPASPCIVLFDGVCGFCDRLTAWLFRHDREGALVFIASQSDAGEEVMRACGITRADESIYVVTEGRCLSHSDAVLEIARRLPPPWRGLSVARWLPRAWRDAAYRAFAKRRYRWFGKRDECRLPSDAERARFPVSAEEARRLLEAADGTNPQ